MRLRRIALCAALALIVGACGSTNDSNSNAGGSTTTTTKASVAVKVVKGSGTLTAAHGGVVLSDDGLFALYVPPGALAKDTDFKVSPVASADLAGPLAGAEIRGAVHGVEPTGLKFAKPALVLRSVDTEAAGLSQTAAPLVDLVSASGDTFDVLGNQVVVDYGSQALVAATTTHLTQFIASGDQNTQVVTQELERVPVARDMATLLAVTPGVEVQTTDAPLAGTALPNTIAQIVPDESLQDGSLPPGKPLDLETIVRANRFDQAHIDDLYGFFSHDLPNMIDQGMLDGAHLVDVGSLGSSSYCDRTAFSGRQGLAMVPMFVTPPPGATMRPIGLRRPRTLILRRIRFDCRTSKKPSPRLTLTTAQACVIHKLFGKYPSHIRIRSDYSNALDSLSLTLSNGANGGAPVVANATGQSVETNVGIAEYGNYDVIQALAKGTNGETVDLTEAFAAAIGSMQVTSTEGALGKTPTDACN